MKTMSRAWRALDRGTRLWLTMWIGAVGAGLAAFGIACLAYDPFAEFARRFLTVALSILATPVVFEGTFLFLGILLVASVAALRSRTLGDEWVEDDGAGEESEAADEIALAVAEGSLELGSADDAWEALLKVPKRDWDSVECARLRLRVSAMTGRWQEGEAAAAVLERHADAAPDLAAHCLARARHLAAAGAEAGAAAGRRASDRAAARLIEEAARRWPASLVEASGDAALRGLIPEKLGGRRRPGSRLM